MAAAMVREAEDAARATGNPVGPYGAVMLAAWGGREAEATQLITAVTPEMAARGEGQWLTAAAWATAVLRNGLGHYEQALAAAEQGSEYPAELGLATWSLVELVEAAARTGTPERAAGALQRLGEATSAAGTDWALGLQARSRALLADDETAERLYLEAIERLGRTRLRGGAGPRPAAVRRMAAPPEPARGRARAAADRLPDAHRDGQPRASPSVPATSWKPPARTYASARSRRPTGSPRKRRRSPRSRGTGIRTPRSAPSCSSARERSNGTCARCSPSSASAHARSSAWPCPTWNGCRCRRSHTP